MSQRRPIRERSTPWAAWLARQAARRGLSPNQISVASVGFSLAGSLAFLGHHYLAAALGIVARLLCNMIDGMVAVEHDRKSPSGEIYNELPDRLSDSLSLLGFGYACGWVQLGLWASLLAVLTAYIRTLATLAGAPADFGGPMAKQQRMKLLVAVSLVLFWQPHWGGFLGPATLVVICLGCWLTCWRRTRAALAYLELPPR